MKNGPIKRKSVQCNVPERILKVREESREGRSQRLLSIGAKIKKDKDLFFFFGRPVFKFMVYLNGSRDSINRVRRVDYFFKDESEGKERKVTSFKKSLKFSTPVFLEPLIVNSKLLKQKLLLKMEGLSILKGSAAMTLRTFPFDIKGEFF